MNDEEDSDEPQQLEMQDANSQGEIYDEDEESEDEEAPQMASNINKSK